MSRLWLLLISVIALLVGQIVEGRFTCPLEFPCNCSHVDNNDFRLQCPTSSESDSFQLAIKPGEWATIECNGQPSWADFMQGAVLDIGPLSQLSIISCAPLDVDSKQFVYQALGVRSVTDLKYEYLKGHLSPENFDAFSELKYLELAENPLGKVNPDLLRGLENLTYLGLRETNISLPLGFFNRSRNLQTIELSYNNLKSLQPGIFDGLESVKRLHIWKNQLRELDPRVFRHLGSLALLDLNNNWLSNLPVDLFEDLESLEVLNIGFNNVTSLPAGLFKNNRKLHTFKLFSNKANLTSLPSGLLADLPLLTVVQLQRIGLRQLPEDIFWNSDGLEELDLSRNLLTELPENLLKDATVLSKFAAAYNDIVQLPDLLFARRKSLETLDLSFNRIQSIDENTLEGLTALRELNLQDNDLTFIHVDAFQDLDELRIANFANNKLTMFTDIIDMYGRVSPLRFSPVIEELYLANNNVSELFSDWVVNALWLRKLDLYNNTVTEIRAEDLQFVSENLEVDLRENKLSIIDLSRLELLAKEQDEFVTKDRNVRVLLSRNPIDCGCTLHSLIRYANGRMEAKALKYVHLMLDELRCATPDYARDYNVKELDEETYLCQMEQRRPRPDDPCVTGCDCWFRPSDKTMLMDCSDMGLLTVPERLYTHGVMSVELDFSDNGLVSQPDMRGWGYEKVRELDLSRNRIAKVNESLITPRLRILKLDGNNLTSLDSSFLSKLSGNESLITELTLQNNPWRCDCEASELLSFVKSRVADFPGLRNASCANSTTTLVELSYSDICPFPYQLVVTLSIIFGLGLGLLGLLVALYYRFERHIKIWLYSKNLCMCLVTEAEVDRDKNYDAFISYSHKDEEFVMRELVSQLETGPFAYRLCIHTRDWLAGDWIPAQIERSVEASRRTIVVLSKNFLDSVWSRLEFQAAHKQALMEKRNRVIVVLLGDIGPTDDLDPDLRAYLQTNTYVKWGEPWFWRKLSYALPHRIDGSLISGLEEGNVVLKGVKIIQESMDDKMRY